MRFLKGRSFALLFALLQAFNLSAQKADPYKPDYSSPPRYKGMQLVWNDEFNYTGRPDTSVWRHERGFVRNQELQWYKPENASVADGVLLILGKREKVANPLYKAGSTDWKTSRQYAEYTSSSIQTRGKKEWLFGRFEIRARIDTAHGSWPAIWTLGVTKPWPSNGEIDIMEFYRIKEVPTILANFAWGTEKRYVAKWDDLKKPLSDFTSKDPGWPEKFHVWRMDWSPESVAIYLDDELLNSVEMTDVVNPDGFKPYLQPHYILLNLALGAAGGDPSHTGFPISYEVDYVRVYQLQK